MLVDASNHKYTFGTYTLGKGKTVTVRTGKGTNTSATRYQGRSCPCSPPPTWQGGTE